MKIRTFIVAALLAAFPFFSIVAAVDYRVEDQSYVLEKALQLEHKGTLKQKDNGYLYVEVSKEYLTQILPLIEAPGKLVPPRHCSSKKGIGPHISVMYENERIENEIWSIDELGQEISFSIVELRTVKLNKDGKMKKLWFLAVCAPELEMLRQKYGLPSKLKGHDFHITLCYQVPGQPILIPIEVEEAA